MSELELQKAKWAREDFLRERERKEKLSEENKIKKTEKRKRKQLEKQHNDLMKQSEDKRQQAKNKFTQLIKGFQNRDTKTEVKKTQVENVSFGSAYSSTALKYFGTFLILILNLLAVSISLNCNKDSNLIVRIILALLAFFFSIPYIIIHLIRIVIFKKERCSFKNVKFFM